MPILADKAELKSTAKSPGIWLPKYVPCENLNPSWPPSRVAEDQAATKEGKLKMICSAVFEYASTRDVETFLDWQVDEAKTTELGRQLQNNRDRDKRLPPARTDRERRILLRLTVSRAVEFIKGDVWNARQDWARAKFLSKRDGKEFDIPAVNVEKRMNEIGRQQEEKWREIVLG